MVSPDFTPAAAPALRLPEISLGPLAPAALESDAIPADRPNRGRLLPVFQTQRLGSITYDPESGIEFPRGLPGSDDRRAFLAVRLPRVEAADTGTLKSAQTATQQQVTDIGAQIGGEQSRIDQRQTQLTAQVTAADAAISTMEQQYNYLNGLFSAMQTADRQCSTQ